MIIARAVALIAALDAVLLTSLIPFAANVYMALITAAMVVFLVFASISLWTEK